MVAVPDVRRELLRPGAVVRDHEGRLGQALGCGPLRVADRLHRRIALRTQVAELADDDRQLRPLERLAQVGHEVH